MFNCPNCDYQNKSLNSLRIHASKRHQISSESLYLSVVLNGIRPNCECGCGSHTKFNSLSAGYSKFVLGHASRVHNNWGHNPTAQAKSIKKRREEGLWSKREPWNKGKSKETDSEFAVVCNKAYNSKKEKNRKSNQMKSQWESGNLLPLTGSSHSQWQGGTSRLSAMARSHIYSTWTFPQLKADDFTCQHCGAKKDLAVHHDGVRFAQVMEAVAVELGDPGEDFELKSKFAARVAEYHEEHSVSGITLCTSCHRAVHATEI